MSRYHRHSTGWAWLALLALLPLGCGARHLPMLELHRSSLVTPTGRVPLEIGTNQHSYSLEVNYGQILVAVQEDLYLRFGVFRPYEMLLIDFQTTGHEIEIVEGESFYQLNGEERVQISPSSGDADGPVRREHHRFEFELPPPLSTYPVAVTGGTLPPVLVERIEAGEGDVHTIYLPFRVDGELYAIDLEFSVRIKTRYFLGAPATP